MLNDEKRASDRLRAAAWRGAHPEQVKATNAAYREVNKENLKVAKAAWHAANSARLAEQKRTKRLEEGEAIRAAQRASYARRREKVRADQAKYYEENREAVRLAQKAWRLRNPHKVRAGRAKWIEANRDQVNRSKEEWRRRNRGYSRAMVQNRRARKRLNGGTISKDIAQRLYTLQKGKCPCCKQPLGRDFHLDHIIPIALGGANVDANIQLLRRRCNIQKSAKHPVDFMQQRGYLL